jgi:hypothetical protein
MPGARSWNLGARRKMDVLNKGATSAAKQPLFEDEDDDEDDFDGAANVSLSFVPLVSWCEISYIAVAARRDRSTSSAKNPTNVPKIHRCKSVS